MSSSIMEDLYYGRLRPGERATNQSSEYRETMEQIEALRQRLSAPMTPEDRQGLMDLGDLYAQYLICEDVEVFSRGLTLGMLLMQEVMEKKAAYLP